MRKTRLLNYLLLALGLPALTLTACSKQKNLEVKDLFDPPRVEQAQLVDLPEYCAAYGIVVNKEGAFQLEVNIEANDSAKIKPGQHATAYITPRTQGIQCVVSKVLRSVSTETGQSIAWLKPPTTIPMLAGEFVYANISTDIKRHVLAVPSPAVLIRNGRALVIRQETIGDGQSKFTPVEVQTGASSPTEIEIKSGLKPKDQIVVEGGIGFLFPDFKAGQSD